MKKTLLLLFILLRISISYSQDTNNQRAHFSSDNLRDFIRNFHESIVNAAGFDSTEHDFRVFVQFQIGTKGKIINLTTIEDFTNRAVYVRRLLYATDRKWVPLQRNSLSVISDTINGLFFFRNQRISAEAGSRWENFKLDKPGDSVPKNFHQTPAMTMHAGMRNIWISLKF